MEHPLTVKKVKRLFIDIEVTPNVVLAWRAGFDLNISHDSIIKERKVICLGFKWQGDKEVHVIRWDKDQCDRELLRDFAILAEEADEIIGYYSDRFDLPWLRTRMLIHKLPPIPVYKTIDVKAWASKYYYFNSNKLDYVSEVLGHGKKLKTDFDLWKNILLYNCQKSMDYMCKYCGIDIDRLEKVYNDLKFCVKPKTHAGVFAGGEKWSCPRCSSADVKHSKIRVSSSGTVSHQMRCRSCGGYHAINERSFSCYNDQKRKV